MVRGIPWYIQHYMVYVVYHSTVMALQWIALCVYASWILPILRSNAHKLWVTETSHSRKIKKKRHPLWYFTFSLPSSFTVRTVVFVLIISLDIPAGKALSPFSESFRCLGDLLLVHWLLTLEERESGWEKERAKECPVLCVSSRIEWRLNGLMKDCVQSSASFSTLSQDDRRKEMDNKAE